MFCNKIDARISILKVAIHKYVKHSIKKTIMFIDMVVDYLVKARFKAIYTNQLRKDVCTFLVDVCPRRVAKRRSFTM